MFQGVNISRSPGGNGGSGASVHTLSPSVIKANSSSSSNNRNRSSSLVVPPVIRRKASSSGSPGSKSLHLSPLSSEKQPRKSQTLFTFPDPKEAEMSSILHVHERYLSSEDFHEALFFEKSPKSGQRKRSRKSSKEANNKKLSVTQL